MPLRPAVAEPAPHPSDRSAEVEKPLDAVADALGRMRFGVIQLTVHDGRLVQMDVTERRRFA